MLTQGVKAKGITSQWTNAVLQNTCCHNTGFYTTGCHNTGRHNTWCQQAEFHNSRCHIQDVTTQGCCIPRGPSGERIVDIVPGGTELELQLRRGLGRSHPLSIIPT